MDEIHIEKNLYRILQGRLRFKRDGLVLFIEEPTQSLLYESFEIYEEAYKAAYAEGVYLKCELPEVLLDYGLWSPLDDRQAKEIQKKIDDQKIEAFRNHFKPRELGRIKWQIINLEKSWSKCAQKKKTLDHASCEGVAQTTRWNWLVHNATYFKDGTPYDWNDYSLMDIMNYYTGSAIAPSTYRAVARQEPWRSMWNVGKNTVLFDTPSSEMTLPQSQLCSYSRMYDNVYEHPEAPPEKVIEDDICLDGWFLMQKRKSEKMKKEQEIEDLIQNPKIKQSGEIFVAAKTQEDIDAIYNMNTPMARDTVTRRKQLVAEKGQGGELVKHTEFEDVKHDISIQQNQQFKESRSR